MATVLITGTSRGIGFETALAFARAGHNVFATMRDPAKSPQLAQIAAKEKLSIRVSVMDVDSDDSVRQAIAQIQRSGPIDVLVNNAGIERTGSIEELPLAEFRAVMETNYFGAIRCIQSVVPEMRKRRSGCIINVSSVAGRICNSPLSPYCASKWALEAMSEGLAGEMKMFGVRVALVEPGIIATDMPERIGNRPNASGYPQEARMAALFSAALKQTAPPSLVATKIVEIAESESWTLRYPVGPDAEPFLQWRRSMTDEQWVELNSSPDEVWYQNIQRDFGMDTRPKKDSTVISTAKT